MSPPPGFHSVNAYLVVQGASQAIEFYQAAFGARERFRLEGPDGQIGHAELTIGDSCVMLGEEAPALGRHAPLGEAWPPLTLSLYVDSVDETVSRALQAGATIVRPVQDQFYGDRTGTIKDPYGHYWTIATPVEDVAPDEMQSRYHQLINDSPS